MNHSLYWMTFEECFIKLTKTGMLKGSKKFKSRIVYRIKWMSHKSWESNHILKPHNITIAELFQFICSFFLFSFSAIFYNQKEACLDTTIPCEVLSVVAHFLFLANGFSVGFGWRFHCNVSISYEKISDMALF